jgi:hypothetical protein
MQGAHEKYQHYFGRKAWRTRSFGKPSSTIQAYMGIIKMYLLETWDERMDWIYSAQGKGHSVIFCEHRNECLNYISTVNV